MNGKLHLAVVDSPSQERALFRKLSSVRTPLAARVAPVRKNELRKMKALAKRCERETTVTFLEANGLSESCLGQPADQEYIPDMVVFGPALDPAIKDLAVVLCGRQMRLEDFARDPGKIQAGQTVLFLWSPDKTPMRTIIEGLEAATDRDCRIGLLPCLGSADDRWSVLKVLSFPVLPNRYKSRVISSSLPVGNAPRCVRGFDNEVARNLQESLDVLAFEGHGNPQDLFLGRHAILCARQGARKNKTLSGLFPCFHDGVCFRRTFRLPDAELIGGNALNTLFLLALTCYYVHLGKSPFSQASGLSPQIMSGATVAVISSPGVIWNCPATLILGLSLIHEGMPLCDVAHSLDQQHRHRFGFSTGLPASVPAIMLFGNPCARLRPSNVTDAQLVHRNGSSMVIQAAPVASGIGAFIRVPLDARDRSTATWSLEGLPPGAWVHGARQSSGDRECLYLWVGDNNVTGNTFRLSILEQSKIQEQTARNYLENLDFWFLFLDYSLEVREGRQGNVALLQQALQSLHRWQRRFTGLAMNFKKPRVTVVVNGVKSALEAFDGAVSQMRDFSKVLLDLATDVLAYDGFNDIGVYGPMLNGRTDMFSGRCACNESELQTHQWLSYAGARPEAYRHACPCGSAGIDSYRHDVTWKSAPLTARRSEPLRLSIAVKAPAESFFIISARVVLVRPTHDRCISGPILEVVMTPEEQTEIACELIVPADIPPGLHEVSFLAVISGALVQRCYMIDVQPN